MRNYLIGEETIIIGLELHTYISWTWCRLLSKYLRTCVCVYACEWIRNRKSDNSAFIPAWHVYTLNLIHGSSKTTGPLLEYSKILWMISITSPLKKYVNIHFMSTNSKQRQNQTQFIKYINSLMWHDVLNKKILDWVGRCIQYFIIFCF